MTTPAVVEKGKSYSIQITLWLMMIPHDSGTVTEAQAKVEHAVEVPGTGGWHFTTVSYLEELGW